MLSFQCKTDNQLSISGCSWRERTWICNLITCADLFPNKASVNFQDLRVDPGDLVKCYLLEKKIASYLYTLVEMQPPVGCLWQVHFSWLKRQRPGSRVIYESGFTKETMAHTKFKIDYFYPTPLTKICPSLSEIETFHFFYLLSRNNLTFDLASLS